MSVSPIQISDAAKSAQLVEDDEDSDDSNDLDVFEVPVWMLYLNGEAFSCKAQYLSDTADVRGVRGTFDLYGGEIRPLPGSPVVDAIPLGLAGMLGTPIMVAGGTAIGVMTEHRWGPLLFEHLPGWLLRDIAPERKRHRKRSKRT